VAAKAHVFDGALLARVFNADDPAAAALVPSGDHVQAVGFTLAEPAPGMLGVQDGDLVDHAFVGAAATTLAEVGDVQPAAPHNVANALAAAALARAYGVPPAAVRDGLLGYRPEPHRIAQVAVLDEVTYVDDSKATNPHAAAASLAAYPSVVWIAGGLAKGADFDSLVAGSAGRLRAVILLGHDREVIRGSLARHAPQVPIVDVTTTETDHMATGHMVTGHQVTGHQVTGHQVTGAQAMARAVTAAAALARPGDTVLLAPACASWDMFANYAARGDAFIAAVRDLVPRESPEHRDGRRDGGRG
jgi:UDP-N-acetylmuramoylalanine--D-glutamate ligase